MKNLETTLALLRRENEILLAVKKRGFGEGKYNGVGGKLENGETHEEAMIRETEEEIMVTPTKYEYVGQVEFEEYFKGEKQHLTFHLYVVYEWIGTPSETEEMKPEWFPVERIPYDKMFKDDKYWLPIVLEGKKIKAHFTFDEDWNLVSKEVFDLEKVL